MISEIVKRETIGRKAGAPRTRRSSARGASRPAAPRRPRDACAASVAARASRRRRAASFVGASWAFLPMVRATPGHDHRVDALHHDRSAIRTPCGARHCGHRHRRRRGRKRHRAGGRLHVRRRGAVRPRAQPPVSLWDRRRHRARRRRGRPPIPRLPRPLARRGTADVAPSIDRRWGAERWIWMRRSHRSRARHFLPWTRRTATSAGEPKRSHWHWRRPPPRESAPPASACATAPPPAVAVHPCTVVSNLVQRGEHCAGDAILAR
jgi:hypothetical protein